MPRLLQGVSYGMKPSVVSVGDSVIGMVNMRKCLILGKREKKKMKFLPI